MGVVSSWASTCKPVFLNLLAAFFFYIYFESLFFCLDFFLKFCNVSFLKWKF